MDLRPPNMPFNQDALNCIHQLVARGYDKDAIIIYKLIDTTHSTDSDGASRMAHNVIRTMVMAGRVGSLTVPHITQCNLHMAVHNELP